MLVLHSCSLPGRSVGSQSDDNLPSPSLHSIVLVLVENPHVAEHYIRKIKIIDLFN